MMSKSAWVIEVAEAEFDEKVLKKSHEVPVVVDFWAPWCSPCRMVAPELEKVAAANRGRWVVAKVNTDEVPELGARFGIQSIPTMAVFQGGKEVGRSGGARPAAGPYCSMASPLAASAAVAQADRSAMGKDSFAGTPRVKLMVSRADMVLIFSSRK